MRIGEVDHSSRINPQRKRIDWVGYFFVIPFFLPFFLFSFVSIVFGAFVAFTNWQIVGETNFVGFENFVKFLNDRPAWDSFIHTFYYALLIVPSVILLAFLGALFVNEKLPGHTFARWAFYAPNVVSAPVIGLVWVWMLDTQYGIINQYFGLSIPWLTNPSWSIYGVSLASIWWDLGLAFILFLAGLQEVDRVLLEAARVDGARRIQSLRYVVVPLLRRTFALILTLQCISTFRIFSQVKVMTNGGPAGSSSSVVEYIYDYGIAKFELGYAAALSLLLFILIMAINLILRKIFPDDDK